MKKINLYKNIFFDRDGIINEVIIRNGIVSSPRNFKEFVIRNEFRSFFNKLSKDKHFFVVTNQPDISRDLLSKHDLNKMHDNLLKKFQFNEIVYCPHDNYHNCDCRKPKPGMVNHLIDKFALNREECLIIGDSKKDAECGINANINYVLLSTIYNNDDVKLYDTIVENLEDLL